MVLLQRILGAVLGIALFIVAFIFAGAILAVAMAVGLVLGVWLWWRTRALRREAARADAAIIEGEFRVEREVVRVEEKKD